MNDYPGKLIVVEGLDGSGTTTLCDSLKSEIDAEFTQEPSSGKYGRLVREELKSGSDPTVSDFFLFLADRYDHCNSLIGPLLEQGKTVVTDRYNLSTYAYQAPVIDESINGVFGTQFVKDTVSSWVIKPDKVLYIDVPVEECISRKKGDSPEKYENTERLERAREIYKYFTNQPWVVEIDGTQSEDRVLEEAIGHIEKT